MPNITWPWAYGGSNTTLENTRRTEASLPACELWYGEQARVSPGEPLRVIDWLEVARMGAWLWGLSWVDVLYHSPAWTIPDIIDPSGWTLKDDLADWNYNDTVLWFPTCVGGCTDTEIVLTKGDQHNQYHLTASGKVVYLYAPVADGDNWQYQMIRAAAIGAPPTAIEDGEWVSGWERTGPTDYWPHYSIAKPPKVFPSAVIPYSLFHWLWFPILAQFDTSLPKYHQVPIGTTNYWGIGGDRMIFPIKGSDIITGWYVSHTGIGVADAGLFLAGQAMFGASSEFQIDAITHTYEIGDATGKQFSASPDPALIHPATRLTLSAEVLNSQRRRIELCSALGAVDVGTPDTLVALTIPDPTMIYNPLAVGGRRY